MLRSSSTSCTGIHVAPQAVYAVELTRRRERVSLTRCAAIRLERPLALPEALADDDGRRLLVDALAVLRRGGTDVDRPYFALAGAASFIKRRFAVPRAADETRRQLLWEAAQLLEGEVDDYVIDTLTTPRHGFFIAARREILDLYGALCRQARLGRPGFDMTSFALCNALEGSGAGGGGIELILHDDGVAARAVLLRDGAYEGESSWSLDDVAVAEGLRRLCTAELSADEAAAQLWLAGDGPAAGGDGIAARVADLDPLSGLPASDDARAALDNAAVPPRAWAVAAGLAFRGLADA